MQPPFLGDSYATHTCPSPGRATLNTVGRDANGSSESSAPALFAIALVILVVAAISVMDYVITFH